jgi:transposase
MITPEMRAEMRRLVIREGWKIETVARRFGVHHSVVRRAVASDREGGGGGAPPAPSALEPFKPYIVERLTQYPALTATRLLLELRDRGYKRSLTIVRRYVAKVRAPRSKKAYLRVETEPGEVAQVDWGSFGHLRIGSTQRPLSAFAIVLKWSRVLYVDFSLDQRMDTFLRMHARAFAFFGGVPKRVIYDNLKSVVLHHVGTTVQFNPAFLAFAGHMLFEPVAAPVRYPQAKGNVENAIKYIRTSFFYGRSFHGIEDVRAQAAQWLREVANARIHGTTRERPADRHLLEKTRLHALPEHPFDTDLVVPLIISKEARVHLDSNSYSVPDKLDGHSIVGKSVHLRANDDTVRVVLDGKDIAEHPRCWDRHRAIEHPAHIDALLERRPSARAPRRRDRLAALSPGAAMYLQEVARRRIHLETEIRKLLRLLDLYGEAEVERGMVAALAQRTFGARYVRALIDQARFAAGVAEPLDPVVTGNAAADNAHVTPHDLEKYDALF